jgi:EAL domain-containing protein (putative c-di-GMP-specific phosphodiesterase class I)
VRAIIDLANNFNLKVVAEGVENKDQLEILRQHHVPIYQGFYFSKPLPLSDINQQLEENYRTKASLVIP